MTRLVLDAGAFVAFERGDVTTRARFAAARRQGLELATTSPVIAQVWRDGRRQSLIARLAAATRSDAPDEVSARRAGELLAKSKTSDVVDAFVVDLARDGDTVMTSDPDDIQRLLTAAGTSATVLSV